MNSNLRSRIIPVLLLSNRGLVKTRRFSEPKYVGDPLNCVRIFNEKEVDELVFLDIDATVKGTQPDYKLLSSIASQSRMPLCYGGGVKSAEQAIRIIEIGFEKVSVSSGAIENPKLLDEMANLIGSQSVVLTLDVKKNRIIKGYSVFCNNGKKKVESNIENIFSIINTHSIGELVINSIDNDGMMKGFDLDLSKLIRQSVSCPVTMIGGAGSTKDMINLISSIGTCGVGIGSFFVFKGQYRAVLINYYRPKYTFEDLD